MLVQLADVVYVLLPAYAANMAAPFSKFWPGPNRPISARLLGNHKTVVGFALGVAAALLVSFAQAQIAWAPLRVANTAWLVTGLAQGIGAMGGDAVKSFFKRRRAIAPGASWIPADQLDFVTGAILLGWPWLRLGALEIALALAFTFVADIIVNHIAFRLGIRDTSW